MRSAITILSLVAAIAAEAPYNLPRPAANAPAFHYPTAPAPPPPPPPPPRPVPQFEPQPAPQPFIPNFGYQYQQPSFGPAFVHHAPAPAPAPVPVPQPIQYQPQPQPVYIPPIPHPQPIAYSQPPQPLPITYQPPSTSYGIPQPNIVSRPIISQPQGEPIQLFHATAPQPALLPQPAPQPAPLLQPAPQPQPIAQFQPQPIPQFQPQSVQVYQPVSYPKPQFNAQQGYSYQQPQAQPQPLAQVPLQAQPLTQTASVLSSYQADSNQYSSEQAQTHREALDSVVVDRVQSLIKDNEHSSARNAGYQSLVSGVSLENARPSVEISSFVHTSPLNTDQISVSQRSSGTSGTLAHSLSADYGLPSSAASTHSSESVSSFLPHTQPATSYGPPN